MRRAMDADATLRSLRAALAASFDDVPLRRHLAETPFAHGPYADAGQERRAPKGRLWRRHAP